ncbi:zinc finger protein 883-like isoform X2 [Cloeon dipterum]|uniref:zinc finger protein 883-like isoform X2 n=1 Tax=Cloeon dipterum TaxID=197152 RepID=UPI00321F60FB
MATGNILDLCRLCGTDTLSMSILRHNIFDDEGQLKKFAEKISSCLPVNVAEEDPLPKIMCGECAYKLDLLSEFREKSAKTESALMVLLKQDIKHEASDVEEQTEVKEATETVNLKRQSSRRSVKTRRYFVDSESEEDTQQSDDDFHCDDNYRDDDDEDSEIAEPVKKKERRSMPTRASKKTNNKKAALEKEEITAEFTWPWKGVKLPCGRRKKKPIQPEPQSDDDLMKIEVIDVRSLPDFSAEPALPPENVTVEEFNNPLTARADFTCSQCHIKFKNYGSYTNHSKKPHTYHCKWCNRNFVNARGEHACAFKCTKCEFRYFKTNGALRSHTRWFHTGDEFLCHDCGAKCPTKLSMRTHYKKVHIKKQSEDQSYKTWCSECQRSFSSTFSLMKHKQRKHEGKILCSVCPEAFASKEERREHVKLVHPSTREKQLFDCPECGKKLSSRAMMQVHVDNIHKKLKPHLCQVCGKAFAVVSHLKLHMMMHTGEKKHVCKVCGHAFARIENLTQHKRIHEDLKPFLCDFCPMKFRQQSSLKSHRRIHTGETPYKCQLCPSSFRSKQQLDNHVKFHPS